MKCILAVSVMAMLISFSPASGQAEGSLWMADGIPFGGTNYGIDFSGSTPSTFSFAGSALASVRASQAICDAAGVVLFYTGGNSCKVFDRNGNVMPNGNGLQYPTTGTTYSIAPLIAPHVGDNSKYYIFYQKNGNLYYSLVDMTLNSGNGDVVLKNITINAFSGTGGLATTSKITLVQGCKSIWLVARSRNAAEYRAYELTDTGLNTVPVISYEGGFPTSWYNGDVIAGKLKATPDGQRLGATISKFYDGIGNPYPAPKGGIELYDFEKCSGSLKNSMIIDSAHHYDGLAFSPDNTKLYASSGTDVFQFDISLPDATAIMASKTYILSNTVMPVWVIGCGFCDTTTRDICDLKLAPNGKIYMGNNRPDYCIGCLPASTRNTYHSIENPNLAGMAATPVTDAVLFPVGGYQIGLDLPPDIVVAPVRPDTFTGSSTLVNCFTDTMMLKADTSAVCISWDDGSAEATRKVTTAGIYYVAYSTKTCEYHIDTFFVDMVPMPQIVETGFSCPNAAMARAIVSNRPGLEVDYSFTWKDVAGNILKSVPSALADTVIGLTAGLNYLQVNTSSGCDTTIAFHITALPLPEASFNADTLVCKNEKMQFQNTSTAPLYRWEFGDGNQSEDHSPSHAYTKGGEYFATLAVKNIEGCTDTSVKAIRVNELLLNLKASEHLVERGGKVNLSSSAPESYTVTGWEPVQYFPNQNSYNQQLTIQMTDSFTVHAVSDDMGCKASATATITVEPFLQMPNAFSPNGDGLNDRFCPLITGTDYHLVSFMIYNRLGQLVYESYLNAGLQGWDGYHNNVPAEIGTYFYQVIVNNPSGKQISKKGEVTLVR